MTNSPIRKILVLSTGHIPKHTAEALGCHGRDSAPLAPLWPELTYEPYSDYGWFVWAHCDGNSPVFIEHAELSKVLAYARAQDCDWVLFDCDADFIDGLPTFDW